LVRQLVAPEEFLWLPWEIRHELASSLVAQASSGVLISQFIPRVSVLDSWGEEPCLLGTLFLAKVTFRVHLLGSRLSERSPQAVLASCETLHFRLSIVTRSFQDSKDLFLVV
jgi:hypothetical protein